MTKEKAIVMCIKSWQGECCPNNKEECPLLPKCFPRGDEAKARAWKDYGENLDKAVAQVRKIFREAIEEAK